jgi:hypothetical protein
MREHYAIHLRDFLNLEKCDNHVLATKIRSFYSVSLDNSFLSFSKAAEPRKI